MAASTLQTSTQLHIFLRPDFSHMPQPKQHITEVEFKSRYESPVSSIEPNSKNIYKNVQKMPLFSLNVFGLVKYTQFYKIRYLCYYHCSLSFF